MDNWRPATAHSPTRKDGDANGCVLAWHIYNGCMVTGAKVARDSSFISHWQKLPMGPGNKKAPERDALMVGALRRWNPQTGALEVIEDD